MLLALPESLQLLLLVLVREESEELVLASLPRADLMPPQPAVCPSTLSLQSLATLGLLKPFLQVVVVVVLHSVVDLGESRWWVCR